MSLYPKSTRFSLAEPKQQPCKTPLKYQPAEHTHVHAVTQIYLDSSALEGRRGENIIMVVLWQMVQEISHLLLSFEGPHFGSYRNRLLLTYVNQKIHCSKTSVT